MQRKLIHQFIRVTMLAALLVMPCADADARTPAPQIATVDMASLVAMHPAMAAYDPNMQSFKVTRPRQQFIQDKSRLAADKAKKIGIKEFLMKPIAGRELAAVLQKHLHPAADETA